MITLLLAIAISAPKPVVVDVCEINDMRHVKQVILYRWTWLLSGRSHHVSQWWIINKPPKVERLGDRWLIESEGRRFIARTLRRTTTQHDPEIADRRKLHEGDRKEYIRCVQ